MRHGRLTMNRVLGNPSSTMNRVPRPRLSTLNRGQTLYKSLLEDLISGGHPIHRVLVGSSVTFQTEEL
jgi:hypothetical protein